MYNINYEIVRIEGIKKYFKYINDADNNPYQLLSVAVSNYLSDKFVGEIDCEETRIKMRECEKELIKSLINENII
jgi:hypothetical protein